jgi:signal transduction histidine kinase
MVGVAVVCLAIAASTVYSYTTLQQLRADYLESRALDLVSTLDSQTRGGGRGGRSDPSVWQDVLETTFESHRATVASIEILNPSGDVIASVGERRAGDILVDREMTAPRQARRGQGQGATSERHVRIAFDPSAVGFISRAANANLAVAAIAILTLLAVSTYSVRVLRRYVTLKEKEQEARHLAALGAMAATLAHEIRNPLGAMKGLTQVAQEQLPQGHESQGHMKTVVAEAERLERLVTDLLQFARPGEPELSEFDLLAAVEQAREMLAPELVARRVQIDLKSDGPCLVRSDQDGIRQVLLNVLLNAVEASSQGGTVEVGVVCGPADRVSVIVDDRGKGLEGRDAKELFEPFVTAKVRGSGLGLAVSRRIVERIGGRISLADRLDGGARCTVSLAGTCTEVSE